MKETEIYNLYLKKWGKDLIKTAYNHPAKMGRGMIAWLYEYLLANDYIKPGDTILDPFGGIAGGALDAMRLGLNWIGVELEWPFVDIAKGYDCPGLTADEWRRYQGRLDRLPYFLRRCPDCVKHFDMDQVASRRSRKIPTRRPHHFQGNIELWNEKYRPWFPEWGRAIMLQGDSRNITDLLPEIGGLISSPPFGPALTRDQYKHSGGDVADFMTRAYVQTKQGQSPGNLAAMPFGAALGSPPYENNLHGQGEGPGARWDFARHPPETANHISSKNGYGIDPANMGNNSGDTFWIAASKVIHQVYDLLTPGGVAVWITGDYVRDGKRVLFGLSWLRLCESAGFVALEHITAYKVAPGPTQIGLFGQDKDHTKRQTAFFRRLANARNPDATIEDEEIWIVQKPADQPAPEPNQIHIVSSSPWLDQEPSHAQNDTPSRRRLNRTLTRGQGFFDSTYGRSPGQLGKMAPGQPFGPDPYLEITHREDKKDDDDA